VGTKEGMFRYADPADGDDALCSTLSELTDSVIAMGGAYPMQLTLPSGVTEFNRSKTSANKVIGATGGGAAAAEEDNVNNTNDTSSNTITRTVIMEKGRGKVSLFINAVKETDITANSSAVHISIPESQCPIAHNFTVPLTFYRPPQQGRSSVSDDVSTSDSSASVVGEWESYLSDEIVTESLELAQQYKQARDSLKLGSASAGNNVNLTRLLGSDFYLHAALLLQRARCLEVYYMFFCKMLKHI
jgi:hypothetical protein